MDEEVTGQHTAADRSNDRTENDPHRSDADSIFSIAPFALLETDANARILAASAAAERLMQLPPGSLRGTALSDFIPREERTAFRTHIANALNDPAGTSWCTQLSPGLGGRIYVRLSITASRSREADRLRWLIEDLTPSRVALLQEKRLAREREARLRAERAAGRFVLLAETSNRLAGAIDGEQAMRSIAECLLPDFADICEIDLADANGATGRHVFVGHDRNGNGTRAAGVARPATTGQLARSMTASLASGGRMFGSLTIGRLPSREAFEDDDFTMLRAMCAQLAAKLDAAARRGRDPRKGRPSHTGRPEVIDGGPGADRRNGADRRRSNATLA